jgi:protein SCO1/2
MRSQIHCSRYAKSLSLLAALFLSLLMAASCGSSSQPAGEDSAAPSGAASEVQRYEVRGKVVRVDAENQTVVLDHEEIVGWMGAMTMQFPVKEPEVLQKLSAGSQIEGTVFVSDDGFYVGEIEVVEQGAP